VHWLRTTGSGRDSREEEADKMEEVTGVNKNITALSGKV
jgi:hypothetical protein